MSLHANLASISLGNGCTPQGRIRYYAINLAE